MSYELSAMSYRTGDLARWLPHGPGGRGVIDFRGRIDQQVKIRGFRVEPGEIEEHLLRVPGIREAVVIPRKEEGEDRYLCAYVVVDPADNASVDSRSLNRILSESLPKYMIPAYFITLEKIPLNRNGKIDRAALPRPGVEAGKTHLAPRNRLERKVRDVWAEVLSVEPDSLGIDDDFFRVGGHSLKATTLAARVHRELNVRIPLAQLFEQPTIAQMAQYIEGLEIDPFSGLTPVEERQYYPLTSSQQQMYLVNKGTVYNVPVTFRLTGEMDRERLEAAFRKMIERHESLRTSFHDIGGMLCQRIHDASGTPFEPEFFEKTVETVASGSDGFIRPFDLSRAPLMRVRTGPLIDGHHFLMVDMHHIITDGTSMGVIAREFMALNAGETLPTVTIQYRDFCIWQQQWEMGQQYKEQESFWKEQLKAPLPLNDLPYDYPRSTVSGSDGRHVFMEIDTEQVSALKEMAGENNVTLFILVFAAYSVLLSRLTGSSDIIVGTPVAARRHADIQSVIGMFVNTLPLRSRLDGEMTFSAFLAGVGESVIESFENQEYPFEQMVTALNVPRDTGRNPIFTEVFSLNDLDIPRISVPGMEMELLHTPADASKFDLAFNGLEEDGKILFSIDYSGALFREETVRRFGGYFNRIITGILDDSSQTLGRFELMPEDEKRRILVEWNDTASPYPSELTLPLLIDQWIEEKPHNIALVSGGQHLSYGGLGERAAGLVRRLKENGVGPESIVGLKMERSIEMMVALVSILKSGGAYLPIDPEYPEERTRFMLKDSQAGVIIEDDPGVESGIQIRIPGSEPPVPASHTHAELTSGNLAYIIYTSGSTGLPKGVLVEHRSVVNLVYGQINRFRIDATDRVLQFSSISFDASVEQIFITLCSGAVLVLIDKETMLDSPRFNDFIFSRQLTHVHAVPSFLEAMDIRQAPSLRRIISGGDTCSVTLAQRIAAYEDCEFYNEYGPTETTVTSLELAVKPFKKTPATLPIGRPLANTVVYVLDRLLYPVPTGVPGNLYIGGDGVTRGYLNRPELTAEKYVSLADSSWLIAHSKDSKQEAASEEPPMSHELIAMSLFYDTGDRVRWLSDGNIEFLGRRDQQVKIRGFRIEPGEIESRLRQLPGVRQALVIARRDESGEQRLCAYLVSAKSKEHLPETGVLHKILEVSLPKYMIPDFFVPLDEIPLTASRKVDRDALPEPWLMEGETSDEPVNRLQKVLREEWAHVLKVPEDSLGINDNFFHVGGQSLKATFLLARIHNALEVKLTLEQLFQMPTIRQQSEYIDGLKSDPFVSLAPAPESEFYPLSYPQQQMYIVHRGVTYNMPMTFVLTGRLDRERLETAFHELLNRHESLRTSFHNMGDRLVQKVHKPEDTGFGVEFIGTPGLTIDDAMRGFVRPFDLSEAPLARVRLARLEDRRHLLAIDMHHIVSDGTSMDIMAREFRELYTGKQLSPMPLQYKDFCSWQQTWFEEDNFREQEKFWMDYLEGELVPLDLPFDFPRPAVRTFEGRTISFDISGETLIDLNRLVRDEGATLYAMMLAIYSLLLSRLTRSERIADIIVGTPVAGRRHADFRSVIGMFVNTVPLRNKIDPEQPFRHLFRQVRDSSLSAFENQEYPLELMVEKLGIPRDPSRNPLFTVTLGMQNTGQTEPDMGDIQMEPTAASGTVSKFDMSFKCMEQEDRLEIVVEYSERLFNDDTVRRFARYFERIVPQVAAGPDAPVKDIEMVSPEEKKQVLYRFNRTQSPYPTFKTVHDMFREQAVRMPHKVALAVPEGRGLTVRLTTYEHLEERSNRLSAYLRSTGIGPGSVTALMLSPGKEMIVSMLAVMKSGACYLPIDPANPRERVEFLLSDSQARLLLTDESENRFEGETVDVGDDRFYIKTSVDESGFRHPDPSDPVYMIYTSGTTGRPKGVLLKHENLVNYVSWFTAAAELDTEDKSPLTSSYSFDLGYTSLYSTLLSGGELHLPNRSGYMNPGFFLEYSLRHRLTWYKMTPSLFSVLLRDGRFDTETCRYLRLLVLGGEAIDAEDVERAFRLCGHLHIMNHYGPTEATIGCIATIY